MTSNGPGTWLPWPLRDVLLADRTLAVRESGSAKGEPAIFIHGLGGSSTNWTDLTGLLADQLDAVAIDLPGFGHTPPPRDGDYTPAGHARSVAALLRDRFDGPAHVFGNSLGGAVAVELAAAEPDLVKSLTLVSPALPEYRPRFTNIQLPIVSTPGVGAGLFKQYLKRDVAARVRDTIAICFHDPGVVPPHRLTEAIVEAERWGRLPYASDAMRSSLRGLLLGYLTRSANPWRKLGETRAPVLAIYGRADQLVNSAAALRITKYVPGARVVVLPGVGHVAQLERPIEVATIWRDWRATF